MPNCASRILIVISSLGGGGAERVVVDLSRYLSEIGRQVTVLTLSGDDPDVYELPPGVLRERMEIRRPATSTFETLRFTIEHLTRMRRRIKWIEPDVAVGFMDQANVRLLAATLGTGLPVLVTERIHPEFHQIGRSWERARYLLYRRARAVIVQTEDIAKWFHRHVPIRRLLVIPNAVRYGGPPPDGSSEAPIDGDYVVAAGRLDLQKGFDILLDAFARSGVARTGWKLVVLGEGPQRVVLEELAAELGLSGAVIMPGHVENVTEWFAAARIFVLSSRYEGFPNVLLEAMQLGVPSISFDCPSGPSDIIVNECNGLLAPPRDTDALSAALSRLAADVDLRGRFSAEATRVNDRFSPQKIYGQWTDAVDCAFRQHAGNLAGDHH